MTQLGVKRISAVIGPFDKIISTRWSPFKRVDISEPTAKNRVRRTLISLELDSTSLAYWKDIGRFEHKTDF